MTTLAHSPAGNNTDRARRIVFSFSIYFYFFAFHSLTVRRVRRQRIRSDAYYLFFQRFYQFVDEKIGAKFIHIVKMDGCLCDIA